MKLQQKKLAIFLEDICEDLEFWYPYCRFREEGAELTVIAPKVDIYDGTNGVLARPDLSIHDASAENLDA